MTYNVLGVALHLYTYLLSLTLRYCRDPSTSSASVSPTPKLQQPMLRHLSFSLLHAGTPTSTRSALGSA